MLHPCLGVAFGKSLVKSNSELLNYYEPRIKDYSVFEDILWME